MDNMMYGGEGGFLTSPPGAALDSPNDNLSPRSKQKSQRQKESIFPLTIKKLKTAQDNGGSNQIDGKDVQQVTVVGMITLITESQTNVDMVVHDGTGQIDIRFYDMEKTVLTTVRQGIYARFYGHLSSYNGAWKVIAHLVTPIYDFNEITYHNLQCIFVHLSNTKGPLPEPKKNIAATASTTGGMQMGNSSMQQPVGMQGMGGGMGMGMGQGGMMQTPSAYMTPQQSMGMNVGGYSNIQQSVSELVQSLTTNDRGVHRNTLIEQLSGRFEQNHIREAIDYLITEGELFTTITVHEARVSKAMSATLRSYVSAPVLARLDSGQTDFLAELRQITVLFVNLSDFTYTDDLPLQGLQNAYFAMQERLYALGGVVRQFLMDDKGSVLIAAFGLPPFSHEDDQIRGTVAAMNIRDVLKARNLNCAIGVTTGTVFCGAVGSEMRREYAMVGDVVNLSARLMGAASKVLGGQENRILVDRRTFDGSHKRISFDSLVPIKVKGKKHAIEVFCPMELPVETVDSFRDRARGMSAMVLAGMSGTRVWRVRPEEKGFYDKTIKELSQNKSHIRCAIVEAEAGMGKSHLMREVKDMAQQLELQVFRGTADMKETATPYYAWRPVFYSLLGLQGLTIPESRHIKQILSRDPELVDLAPLLNYVLPNTNIEPTALVKDMTRQAIAENTQRLYTRLIKDDAEMLPLVIILEDMQYMDSASWSLVLSVVTNVKPVLVILCGPPMETNQGLKSKRSTRASISESHKVPPEFGQLVDLKCTKRQHLKPLEAQEINVLVSARLGVASIPEEVVQFIMERAQGNPFFSEQLGYSLRDSGALIIREGECWLDKSRKLSHVKVPQNLVSLVVARIDSLTPSQQLALKVASVVGRVFTMHLLYIIHPIADLTSTLLEDLEALCQLDLLMEATDQEKWDKAYAFKQYFIEDAAYSTLLFKHRRELHVKVAEYYEKFYKNQLERHYPLLAYHYTKAENHTKSMYYLVLAGESSLASFANQEAIDFFSQALALDEKMEVRASVLDRASWERQVGEAYHNLGDMQTAEQHLKEALRLMEVNIPSSTFGVKHQLRMQRYTQWCRHGIGCQSAVPALEQQEVKKTTEIVRVLLHLARVMYYSCDRLKISLYNMLALNHAECLGPTGELVEAYGAAVLTSQLLMKPENAERYVSLGQECGNEIDRMHSLAVFLQSCGVYYLSAAVFEKTVSSMTQALKLAQLIGDRRLMEECSLTLATCNYLKGDLTLSIKLAQEALDSARQRGDRQSQALALAAQARCQLDLGDLSSALKILDEADYAMEGEEGMGSQNLATAMATRAISALCLVRTDQIKDAADAAEVSLYALRGGNVANNTQKPKAVQEWRNGLTLSRKLKMRREEALLNFAIGSHISGPARRRHMSEATSIMEELGMEYDLERAQIAPIDVSTTDNRYLFEPGE